jgi:hypothetical protein
MRRTLLWLAVVAASACARGSSSGDVDAGGDDVDGEPDGVPDAEPCIPSGPEVCNGVDDDCNDAIDEGFDVGDPCDSADGDMCLDDAVACTATGDASECVDAGAALVELCNGADDDCDPATADGSADAMVGTSCDGTDGDLCVEGTRSCAGGMLQCSDATGTTFDLCNSADDDCDPASADGAEDPLVGPTCDGPDGDLCNEGVRSCSGGSVVCGDTTATTIDTCNGFDDDCDAASADGSEDPSIGVACDGGDGDLCVEGTRTCSGGIATCSDTTGTTFDLCNGADDDCDAASADGAEDPFVGASCDGSDGDSCVEGTRTCAGGNLACSDTTGTTAEACNAFDDDCDGAMDEDFPRDTNPACAASTIVLGSVPGDASSQQLVTSSYDERWYKVTIREDTAGVNSYLSASVQLEVDPAVDFDLYVYCLSCGGALAGQSEEPAGLTEWIDLRKNDTAATDTFDVLIEVRAYSAPVCAPWVLTVISDTAVTAATCN